MKQPEPKQSKSLTYQQSSLKHLASKNLDAALADAFRAAEFGMGKPKVIAHLVSTCIKCDLHRMAEMVARHALGTGVNDPLVYVGLGQSLAKQKRLPAAMDCAKQALKIWPNSPAANDFMRAMEQRVK